MNFDLGTILISWNSKKHLTVRISSAEAKYVATTSISYQAIWLRRLLCDLAHEEKGPNPIFYDKN